MKANISIPNPLYKAAEQLAQRLGISLSELHTAALTSYVITHPKGLDALLTACCIRNIDK